MVKGGWLPGVGAVTGCTVGAILSIMVIVEQMTGDTGDICRHQVVGKVRLFPIFGGVTYRTIFAKAPKVRVILRMARETSHRRILRIIGFVAVFALSLEMLAHEREIRQIVVEDGFFPVHRRMADGAIRAEAAVVCIILKVAARAIFGGILKIGDAAGVLMTCYAACFGVFARERKTCLGMVEICAISLNTIVTGYAIFTISSDMRLRKVRIYALMAFAARSLLKNRDALRMAIGTFKRTSIGSYLMGRERKADQIMWKIRKRKHG